MWGHFLFQSNRMFMQRRAMTMYSSAAQNLQGFHSSLANMFTQQAKQGQLVGCEWDITVMKHLTKMILNTSHSYLDWKSDEWTRDNQISSDLLRSPQPNWEMIRFCSRNNWDSNYTDHFPARDNRWQRWRVSNLPSGASTRGETKTI